MSEFICAESSVTVSNLVAMKIPEDDCQVELNATSVPQCAPTTITIFAIYADICGNLRCVNLIVWLQLLKRICIIFWKFRENCKIGNHLNNFTLQNLQFSHCFPSKKFFRKENIQFNSRRFFPESAHDAQSSSLLNWCLV